MINFKNQTFMTKSSFTGTIKDSVINADEKKIIKCFWMNMINSLIFIMNFLFI